MQRKQDRAVVEAIKLPFTWNGTAQGVQPLEQHNWVIPDLCGYSCGDSAFQVPPYGSSWETEVHSWRWDIDNEEMGGWSPYFGIFRTAGSKLGWGEEVSLPRKVIFNQKEPRLLKSQLKSSLITLIFKCSFTLGPSVYSMIYFQKLVTTWKDKCQYQREVHPSASPVHLLGQFSYTKSPSSLEVLT